MRKLRKKIKRLRSEVEELRDKYEPEICELVAVAPAGPDLRWRVLMRTLCAF